LFRRDDIDIVFGPNENAMFSYWFYLLFLLRHFKVIGILAADFELTPFWCATAYYFDSEIGELRSSLQQKEKYMRPEFPEVPHRSVSYSMYSRRVRYY
jgi:hypothetical protein